MYCHLQSHTWREGGGGPNCYTKTEKRRKKLSLYINHLYNAFLLLLITQSTPDDSHFNRTFTKYFGFILLSSTLPLYLVLIDNFESQTCKSLDCGKRSRRKHDRILTVDFPGERVFLECGAAQRIFNIFQQLGRIGIISSHTR